MEYRTVWLAFFFFLFLLGATVAVTPARVISVLRQSPIAPERWYVKGFGLIGGLIAITSICEIVSIIKWEHLL